MPKKTAAEIDCSSFDQHDLQSLNDFFFFFSVELLGPVIYGWKGLEDSFLTVYYTPSNF